MGGFWYLTGDVRLRSASYIRACSWADVSCRKCRDKVYSIILLALLVNSSYTVHASALLIAFLAILNARPSNRLLTPSSLSINRSACKVCLYFSGRNCSLVLIASGGFVRAVDNDAASVDEVKLMLADIAGEIAADAGAMLVLRPGPAATDRRDDGVSPVAADVVGPLAAESVSLASSRLSPVASPLNVLFPHS